MLKITIIHVGTVKEKYLTDAIAEYEKRLTAYCKLSHIAIKEERLPDKPSQAETAAAVEHEGDRILAAIPQKAFKLALCVEGKMMSSEALAAKIDELPNKGVSELCIIIGGSDGLSPKIKALADLKLSFSPMTFPHQLMRVILLEQLYRCFNISSGGHYHK